MTNISAYNGKVAPIWARRMDGQDMSVWTAVIDFSTLVPECNPRSNNDFMLKQNFPNPFSANTTIDLSINLQGTYSLSLYDLIGARVLDVFENKFLEPEI
jgi:hypothetical protein